MPRVLISVSDKTGIEHCAGTFKQAGFEIVATGGTAKALRMSGIDVIDVSDLTKFPEILDGRVKTLHPAIHAGLLADRQRTEHLDTLDEHEIGLIDVLVSNMYPFSTVIGANDFDHVNAIENIDIGGPAMLRAAAKNYESVIVLVDPADYDEVIGQISRGGVEAVSPETRRRLAAKAFSHVSVYDSHVASYLRGDQDNFPDQLSFGGELLSRLRYGENPHQQAAVYVNSSSSSQRGVATWSVHRDKALSYNNYVDASSALRTVQAFRKPAVAIIKHTIPCGVGLADHLPEAFRRALCGDPVSAFGGVMASNQIVDEETVEAIGRLRLDVLIAPGFTMNALNRLSKRRNLRLISAGSPRLGPDWEFRSIPGGFLVQEPDIIEDDSSAWKCVTKREATSEERDALAFAWAVVRNVKSNAIVLAKPGRVTGVGAGQPNRVESVRIAVKVAAGESTGSVLASDAFFPFADGIQTAAEAGVTAIAQPGGSVRDQECIDAANNAAIAMLFTGVRHFRH